MEIVNCINIEESSQNTMYKDEMLDEIISSGRFNIKIENKVCKVYGKYNEYGVDVIEKMCEIITVTPK